MNIEESIIFYPGSNDLGFGTWPDYLLSFPLLSARVIDFFQDPRCELFFSQNGRRQQAAKNIFIENHLE